MRFSFVGSRKTGTFGRWRISRVADGDIVVWATGRIIGTADRSNGAERWWCSSGCQWRIIRPAEVTGLNDTEMAHLQPMALDCTVRATERDVWICHRPSADWPMGCPKQLRLPDRPTRIHRLPFGVDADDKPRATSNRRPLQDGNDANLTPAETNDAKGTGWAVRLHRSADCPRSALPFHLDVAGQNGGRCKPVGTCHRCDFLPAADDAGMADEPAGRLS